MKVIYILSIILLILSYLLYEKKKEEKNIISSVIYALCLFFCYQTVIVCILSFFDIGGKIIYYSIFHFVLAILLFFITIKKKNIQKYYFNSKDFLLFLSVGVVVTLIVWYRFRGFTILTYASDDSAIHYKTAVTFSHVLKILNASNYHDIIHNNFSSMMPISYINGGFFLYLFSNYSSYKVFMIYDGICLLLYSLLFLSTIIKIIKKRNYVYFFIMTLLYTLGFPLNNLVFGFFYLGLGVMVVNLILYTLFDYENEMNKNIMFKITILFILCYSVFFSYYLFMPFVYLSLGIYYIILYKKKIINIKMMLLYGGITLIIPFIIGLSTFILPSFSKNSLGIIGAIQSNGDIYHNLTTIYFFIITSIYFVRYTISNKAKINFFNFIFIILCINIIIFIFLYILKIVSIYYLYKLFYVYYLFVFIFLSTRFIKKRKIIYSLFALIVIGIILIITYPYSNGSILLYKFDVYHYNFRNFTSDRIRFNKEELEIIDNALQNKKQCEYNHEFIVIGNNSKNMWFYEMTGSIPVFNHKLHDREQLYSPSIFFEHWEELDNHKCLVYFNEVKKLSYDKNKYEVLFENKGGIILKKKY